MTSGTFHSIPVDSITIKDRQRKELKNVPALADSIKRLGLIHPIVVDRSSNLVAGERRLTAVKSLGWTHIPVQFTDEVDPYILTAIELEENIKRENITWQEECLGVARYHEFRKTEPGWSIRKTAEAIGMDHAAVQQRLNIVAEINAGNTQVAKADKFSVARGLVQRAESRKQHEAQTKLSNLISDEPAPEPQSESIICADFREWAPKYSGPKFNLIHCDFPYGVGADSRQQGTSVEKHGGYEDNEDTYWSLCETFARHCNRLADSSCHLVFWFSMRFYHDTWKFLQDETPFEVDPFPLVWHKSDNVGLLPDPERGPRRTYETAFFATRGDRKVVRAVGNSFSGPTVRSDHISEKPQAMLEHFFRMLVDETTRCLDPTCGSGSAIRAARHLRADYTLGLESNPEFVRRAIIRLREAEDVRV